MNEVPLIAEQKQISKNEHFVFAFFLEHLLAVFCRVCIRVDIGEVSFGIVGKFRQISTELWPLIDVENSFALSILSIFDSFFSNLV